MNGLKHIWKKVSLKQYILYTSLLLCFTASIIFVNHNYSFYDHPIAEVIETNIVDQTEKNDIYNNQDYLFTQHIIATLKNGEDKGQLIHLKNQYSSSGAYDQAYKVGNKLFVSINTDTQEHTYLTGTIDDVKRDMYVVFTAWVFIFILLIVGKKQGFTSIITLVINAVLLSYALDIYLHTSNISLLLICSISAILFTVISLLFVNGFNEKTYAAIVATLLGTFLSLLITYFVMVITSENGLRYEGMPFLTEHPQMLFLAGILVGSLGAVMDVAITMSSSIFSLYEKNPAISIKALKESGLAIGRDIMGTMTNILFFVYISGSIPMLLLYFKNNSPLGPTLSFHLSIEMARALAGGIGIVLTIPLGLYAAIYFINKKRARL
ncbi:putative membrane protein [Salirhabdus euzebyi]|uniref:Putative membrane protein n=1 Tax=Salirhabdus euzebyi TaxID=394506 RepID=A0A841PV87_9BACI|nr:YibE/F family protein [Salirhabdus euzebyi]MBB6451634.1 putative membrane protein [Salirhabdus euzebyi]